MAARRAYHSNEDGDDTVYTDPTVLTIPVAGSVPKEVSAIPIQKTIDEKLKQQSRPRQVRLILDQAVRRRVVYLRQLWSDHVSIIYSPQGNSLQDHLGGNSVYLTLITLTNTANERSFHVWLGLSLAFALMGIVIAQTSRIQQVVHPHQRNILRYEVLGATQAAVCHVLAMITVLVGAYRFFREQEAIQYERSRASQWTIIATWLLILLFLLGILILMILVDFFDVSQYADTATHQ